MAPGPEISRFRHMVKCAFSRLKGDKNVSESGKNHVAGVSNSTSHSSGNPLPQLLLHREGPAFDAKDPKFQILEAPMMGDLIEQKVLGSMPVAKSTQRLLTKKKWGGLNVERNPTIQDPIPNRFEDPVGVSNEEVSSGYDDSVDSERPVKKFISCSGPLGRRLPKSRQVNTWHAQQHPKPEPDDEKAPEALPSASRRRFTGIPKAKDHPQIPMSEYKSPQNIMSTCQEKILANDASAPQQAENIKCAHKCLESHVSCTSVSFSSCTSPDPSDRWSFPKTSDGSSLLALCDCKCHRRPYKYVSDRDKEPGKRYTHESIISWIESLPDNWESGRTQTLRRRNKMTNLSTSKITE